MLIGSVIFTRISKPLLLYTQLKQFYCILFSFGAMIPLAHEAYLGGKQMSILHITNPQQINEQVATNKMVVLNFWATWCGPCRMFAEVLEQLDDNNDDIQVLKVNVDEHPEISEKFDVMGIPHTRVILNNSMYEPLVGHIPLEQLEPMLRSEIDGQ